MREDRAVSVPINYALMMAIVVILSSGLLVASSDFVETQRDQALRSGLEVTGNRLANDLAAADRLATVTDAPGAVDIEVALPETVVDQHYNIAIDSTASGAELTLHSASSTASVSVPVRTTTPVTSTTIAGGTVSITYDPTIGAIEVHHG